jgi:hypothetical protein
VTAAPALCVRETDSSAAYVSGVWGISRHVVMRWAATMRPHTQHKRARGCDGFAACRMLSLCCCAVLRILLSPNP